MSTYSINSNIFSQNARRHLANASDKLSSTFQRLSSGIRINSAKDDAAGLAVSSTLHADRRVYLQAVRNANDGISAVNIAEGGAKELGNMLTRMRELAVQASNGSFSLSQRRALHEEARALTYEYNRVLSTTSFNSLNLLNGYNTSLQLGYGSINVGFGQELDFTTGDGTFGGTTGYTGNQDLATVSVDLNNDGNLDIATLYGVVGTNLKVYMGNGDGTFGAAVSYSLGANTSFLSVGDFNGDGKADLAAAAGGGGGAVHILQGDGLGGLSVIGTYDSSGFPQARSDFRTADVNGDGRADLISSFSSGFTDTHVLLGNGDGTFGPIISLNTGISNNIDVGDINGDGHADIILTANPTSIIAVFGNGDGTFSSVSTIATSSTAARRAILEDFNQDGILDLAVKSSGSAVVTIHFGNGDGTFQSGISYNYGMTGNGAFLYSQDVNGDGIADLVSAGTTGILGFSVLLGNTDGSFGAAVSYNTGIAYYALDFGDFNEDGAIDITSVGSTTTSGMRVTLADTRNTTTLPYINLTTAEQAQLSLEVIDTAIDRVERELGNLGASQSRLSYAVETVALMSENLELARSRITDIDVAQETAELVRLSVLQDAATAILAQANQVPSVVLSLIETR